MKTIALISLALATVFQTLAGLGVVGMVVRQMDYRDRLVIAPGAFYIISLLGAGTIIGLAAFGIVENKRKGKEGRDFMSWAVVAFALYSVISCVCCFITVNPWLRHVVLMR